MLTGPPRAYDPGQHDWRHHAHPTTTAAVSVGQPRLQAGCRGSLHIMADGDLRDCEAQIHPEAVVTDQLGRLVRRKNSIPPRIIGLTHRRLAHLCALAELQGGEEDCLVGMLEQEASDPPVRR